MVPLSLIFIVVMGSMFMGWASPTDSRGAGLLATVVLAVCYRAFTWKILFDSLKKHGGRHDHESSSSSLPPRPSRRSWRSRAPPTARFAEIAKYEMTPLIAVIVKIRDPSRAGVLMDQISMMLLTFRSSLPLANALNMDLVLAGRDLC